MAPMSRPTLASRVTLNSDIAFRELDGELVILNLETGIYFGLDPVGARTWKLIEHHGSLGAVLEVLCSEYDASPAVLERDLLELVDQLCAKGLTRVAASSA
ncbi:MAG: PqqD family protein [Candidatus Rokuibacteriota bacterium]|nr:MAG: PqqD family protein [Candidatus Rokubacteria bacterium]PYN72473.1 MAG: PqqD family protein [Candidatus Rokubacteria bacterium]